MEKQLKPSWLYRLFNNLYEVNLYFDVDSDKAYSQKYMMKEIKKINQNYLKGVDSDGHLVEFKTTKSFDYQIKKIY